MKKITALLLALMLVFSLAACGTDNTGPVDDNNEDLVDDANVDGDNVQDVANVDEDNSQDVANVEGEAGDWYDFANIFTLTYYGLTESGEAVAFVMTDDESFAALVVANTETMESASFVGEMTFDEASGTYTITDETSELTLTFSAEFSDDSIALDMGDLGMVVVAPCEQSEAFDLLNAIEIETVAVA